MELELRGRGSKQPEFVMKNDAKVSVPSVSINLSFSNKENERGNIVNTYQQNSRNCYQKNIISPKSLL